MHKKFEVIIIYQLMVVTLLFSCIIDAKAINLGTVDASNRGYIDEYGDPQGSSYEIVNSIVSNSGYAFKNTLMPFGRILRYLESGEIDAALLVPNETTNKVSIPLEYIRDVNFIVVGKKNLKISSLLDISGKSVGYLRLTPTAAKVLNNLDVIKVEGGKYTHMIEMLMRNRIDAIFGPESNIFWALKELGYSHNEMGVPLSVHKFGMYLVYSKKNADQQIMSALTSSAQKLKANHTIQQIIHRYEYPKYQ